MTRGRTTRPQARGATAWTEDLIERAAAAGEDIGVSLQLARKYGSYVPLPGRGDTARRLGILAALGQANLTVARVFEAHTDALAILAEAGVGGGSVVGGETAVGGDSVVGAESSVGVSYGVFAAEGPGEPLRAVQDDQGLFRLTGVKPWCSLGSRLDAGLITAHVADGRRLFHVDLRDPSVAAEPASGWIARGLRTVTSTSLRFDNTPARPVGDVGWYLARPGFSWGGIGVAACWYGASLGLQQSLLDAADSPIDPLIALSVGRTDALLYAAGAVLSQAAAMIDRGEASGTAGELLALRTRAVIADAAERTLREAAHTLGPAPLAFDEQYARRVADLSLYVRQHHADRDLAELGRVSADAGR